MHVCEVCGNDFPLGRVYERCGLKVCHHCCDSERWCPTVTIYPTTVQAWRDMTFSTGGDANDPEWHR